MTTAGARAAVGRLVRVGDHGWTGAGLANRARADENWRWPARTRSAPNRPFIAGSQRFDSSGTLAFAARPFSSKDWMLTCRPCRPAQNAPERSSDTCPRSPAKHLATTSCVAARPTARVRCFTSTRRRSRQRPKRRPYAARRESRRTSGRQGRAPPPLRERAKRKVSDADVKAANDWWDRFFAHRDALGMGSVSGVYKTHIQPVLDLPWSVITPADVERLRDAFDAKVAERKASAKTMFNAWAVWTVASKAAAGQWKKDKRRALKERDDDPSAGIAGPITIKTTPSNCSGSTRARYSPLRHVRTCRSPRAAASCFQPTSACVAVNSRR